jgi:hypothetical protein
MNQSLSSLPGANDVPVGYWATLVEIAILEFFVCDKMDRLWFLK